MRRASMNDLGKICFPLVCFLTLALFCDVATACPTCKEGMHNQSASAFAMSILFMMSMPFLILGGWVFAIYRMRKNMLHLDTSDAIVS
ncbi:MAG: hypothetical protein MK106_04095 [Mariniblastus sp.]|nr:hypothetical protein [Mariniblastus sp.]